MVCAYSRVKIFFSIDFIDSLLVNMVYRSLNIVSLNKGLFMLALIQSGISVFGISIDPALFCFGLIALIFGGLNILEYKRFD